LNVKSYAADVVVGGKGRVYNHFNYPVSYNE